LGATEGRHLVEEAEGIRESHLLRRLAPHAEQRPAWDDDRNAMRPRYRDGQSARGFHVDHDVPRILDDEAQTRQARSRQTAMLPVAT